MYQRMILPRTGRTALLVSSVVACLTAGCTETALDGARERPSRLGMAAAVTSEVVASNRTEHFAESALRIRRHPALGPHTPEEIKRRAAVLIEPPRLATPPASVLASAGANLPPTHQVASLGALPPLSSAPPATADVTRVRAGAESVDLERRPSGGRNVVIPMVVTSNDRGTWRAEDGSGGTGARNGHCRDEALAQLKQHSASGYRIYERLTDKKMFTTWILCDDRQRGLTTAVHEAVHMLTEQLDAYPLIDGGQIARIPALEKFARPGKIAGQFKRSDDFVKTYLRPGGASSADDFTYLLDEFNAYVHDLNTAIQTQSIAPRDVRLGHRDGMSAMMSFLMAYVAMVEQEEPRTWAGLYRPDVKHLVTTLWSEAERTIEKSCAIPRYSVDDAPFLTHICTSANGRALGQLLGRAPRCPRACLGTASG